MKKTFSIILYCSILLIFGGCNLTDGLHAAAVVGDNNNQSTNHNKTINVNSGAGALDNFMLKEVKELRQINHDQKTLLQHFYDSSKKKYKVYDKIVALKIKNADKSDFTIIEEICQQNFDVYGKECVGFFKKSK